MTSDHISMLIKSLYDTRKQKRELETVEQTVLGELRPLVDPKFDALPEEPIVVGNIQFSRGSGESRSINPDLLLERGVSPDITAYSTKVTRYFQYRTRTVKG